MAGVPDVGPVALWGAAVASGLGLLRMWEFYRDRSPQLKVTSMWRGDPEAGNDVLIINADRTPMSIYYFSLVWAEPRRFRSPKAVEAEFDLEDDFSNIEVAPFSSHRLHFNHGDHFSDKAPKRLAGCKLYLRAWVVGRKRPIWRKVFE